MKSRAIVVALLVLGLMPATTAAQSHFGLGGGATLPVGDAFRTGFKMGWNVMGMAVYELSGSPFGVRIDGMYGQHANKSGLPSAKAKILGGTAGLTYRLLSEAAAKPYLIASAGAYEVKVQPAAGGSTTETKFAVGGGAGLSLNLNTIRFFIEARYLNVNTSGSNIQFIPISLGVSFGGK